MIIDEVLYERFWNGKTAADELVHRHGDMLVLFLNSYVKDIHEAEDLMIEAFAQMFVRRRSVSEDGSFRAYLYKTARRLAGNAIKNTEYILDWKNFLSSCRGGLWLRQACLKMNGRSSFMKLWKN
ncbi:MAG: RNA polymerase sigma factor [Ruminococcus sp.]